MAWRSGRKMDVNKSNLTTTKPAAKLRKKPMLVALVFFKTLYTDSVLHLARNFMKLSDLFLLTKKCPDEFVYIQLMGGQTNGKTDIEVICSRPGMSAIFNRNQNN